MFSVNHPNNIGVVNDVTSSTSDHDLDLDNIFHANNIDIGQHDPQLGDAFMSMISPILTGNAELNQRVQHIVQTTQQTGQIPGDEMLKLQMASGDLSQNVTIAAKMVNMGVKFVNELTHLQ